MAKIVLHALIIILFTLYWLSTILYNTPTNFIRIRSDNYIKYFSTAFSQNWAFFAPPPSFNTKIYFSYKHNSDSIRPVITVEVLQSIYSRKQAANPFNEEEEIMDYILSGCAIQINDFFLKQYDLSKYSFPDSSLDFHVVEARKMLLRIGTKDPYYETLIRYSRLIADKKNIPFNDFRTMFTITKIPIPKFEDRFKKNAIEEQILFESNYIDLNKIKGVTR
jgi:hypothetical protein